MLLPLLLLALPAWALQQGPNFPSLCLVHLNPFGSVEFVDPGNARNSDDAYARAAFTEPVSGLNTHYLRCEGLGFSLPDDAIVEGILVEWEVSQPNTNAVVRDFRATFLLGSNFVPSVQPKTDSTPWPHEDQWRAYGGPTDT